MELRHLRYFVAVAEEQNITRAAVRLHVSQPPLSRQIRDLEEELGVELLERTPRAVRLTAAGWAFLEECYRVLRAADDAVRAAQAAATGGRGELRLGYAPGPTQELLREVLRALREAAPVPKIALHDLSTAEMVNGLRERTLDAALLVDPGVSCRRGLLFEKLRAERMVVVLPPAHRWARRKTVRRQEVAGEPLVIFSPREYPEYLENVKTFFGRDAATLRIAEECDSGASLFAAVEAAHGVALVSESLGAAMGARLRSLALLPAPPPTPVGLLYPKGSTNPLVARLLEVARAAVKRRKN
jgi:LysR family transcriptional regulator, benzoate and cis,cis-muconate-responsive activator of ben and cat genes